MSAVSAAARGRALAKQLFESTCVVRAKDGVEVMDPNTGVVLHPAGTLRYSGACRVRPAGRDANVSTAGGGEVMAFDYVVSLPFSVANVAERDEVTVQSSPDSALVGKVIEVQKVDRGESITARRLYCEDVA